jgi:hypothetical protein
MNSIPYQSQTPELPFKDQRGGLKTMGVVLIVLGSFSGCLGVITPANMMGSRTPGMPGPLLRDVLALLVMCLLIAVMLITIGAGSLRIQRWSKPVILVLAGTWAVTGLLGFISWVFFMPSMQDVMNAANTVATTAPTSMPTTVPVGAGPMMSATAMRVMSLMTGFFMVVFMILLPAGFFWFYRRESVDQTLNYFDPTPTWTDRCPTPVLAMSFWLMIGGIMTLSFALWAVTPMFGMLLTGRPAMAVMLGTAILLMALAVGILQLNRAAWWLAVLLVVAGIVNVLMTFSRIDPYDVYRLSGTPPEQLDMMRRMGVQARNTMLIQPVLYGAILLGYLLWIRKYFRRSVDVI